MRDGLAWEDLPRSSLNVEYFVISKAEDYDVLMEHCRRGFAAAAEQAGPAPHGHS